MSMDGYETLWGCAGYLGQAGSGRRAPGMEVWSYQMGLPHTPIWYPSTRMAPMDNYYAHAPMGKFSLGGHMSMCRYDGK